MSRFGKFQAGVGRASANWGVIIGTIVAIILVLLGVVGIIMAFIPEKDIDDNDKKQAKKKRHWVWIPVGLLFILMGIVTYRWPRKYRGYVRKDSRLAQIHGGFAEMNVVKLL